MKCWQSKRQKPKRKPALWVQNRDRNKKPVEKVRKSIRRRTPQRAREEAKYRRRVKVWLINDHGDGNRHCEACVKRKFMPNIATENHHRNGREGRLLLYEPFWIPVCSLCHNWIHRQNPQGAQELGLLGNAGEWNNQTLVPRE